MGRAPCCEKVGLKKGRWTAEEDEILTQYVKANGEGSWRSLPKNAGITIITFSPFANRDYFLLFLYNRHFILGFEGLLRCGKSCRLRWINYLRADLKRGNISSEEESIIIKMHASFGNRLALNIIFLRFTSISGKTDHKPHEKFCLLNYYKKEN